jgi:hypothetical protein
MALVLALAVLLALTIALGSTIAFTTSNQQVAARSNAGQKAYALAEAGINNAVGVIAKCGQSCTTAQVAATPTGPGAASSTVWGGTLGANKTWTITSIGTAANPAAPGNLITRTVSAKIQVNAPPYNFVSLNQSCDNHTLLVQLGGHLTVTDPVYVNSCSTADGFDLFGTGGNLSAPSISTVGGWETHNGSTVTVNGVTCVPQPAGTTQVSAPSTWTGCPLTGQPILADPLAGQVTTPTLGAPAWGGPSAPISIIGAYRSGNVATLETTASGAPSVGDQINVSGVGSGFDGTFTVTGRTTSSFSYANTGSDVVPTVTQAQLTSGTATLTTSMAHNLSVGDTVTVANVDGANTASPFNGTFTVTAVPTPTSFSYSVTRPSFQRTVAKKGLSGGTASLSLTADATHPIVVGDVVNVGAPTSVDTLLNGNGFTISTLPTATTPTYADPATATITLTNQAETITGNPARTVTLNTGANNLVAGNAITVNTTDSRINGTYTLTANPPANQVKFTLPAAPSAAVTSRAISSGVATLTTSSGPPFNVGDTVTVATGGDTRFDGTFTVTAVNAAAKTFSYTPATFQNDAASTSWAYTSATRTVTMTTALLKSVAVGDMITVTGFGGGNTCMNVANVSVTAVNTATKSFSYVVPGAGACTPAPASGNQKETIQLISVSPAATTGTATLVTGASVNVNGSVTVPGYIAANTAASGTITATGNVVATPVSGSFSPAFIPASGGNVVVNHQGAASLPALYTVTASGSQTLQPGTYYGGLCIGVPTGLACSSANCQTAAAQSGTNYSPSTATAAAITTTTQTSVTVNTTAVQTGDYILIDSERMLVTGGGGTTNLTVQRGQLGTTAATHNTNKTIQYVTGTPNVTLAAGTYIMAGGGFFVCGGATVSAPNVLIFNTSDPNPTSSTPYASLDQIQIDTSGSVTLGAQATGLYQGLTIYQQSSDSLASIANPQNPAKCDGRNTTATDILLNASSNGLSGISGTIYEPNAYALFSDSLSGTANLAVLTGCVFINGADSTFNFNPYGLFGSGGITFLGEYGG